MHPCMQAQAKQVKLHVCVCERVRARVAAARCVCMYVSTASLRINVSTAELSCVRRVGREQFALAQLRIRTGSADRQADSREGTRYS